MAMSLDDFVTCLSTSGVLSTEEAKELEQAYPPQKRPKDIQAFARELVGSGKLTKYQAAAIYQGQAATLVFGEYVVLDKLGAGGMGHVFRARHRRMKRIVALKVLPLKAMRTPRAVERFYQEVHTAAQLLHPNIVTAYDANEAGGLHYLAMEYVDGRDLGMLLKQTGPMAMDKVVEYIIQAAQGLEFAHKQGIIHRDIKPANLLLDKKGRVKVLDMGLARVADSMSDADEAAAQGLTQQGEVMGTIDYMAPEQMQDSRSVDLRADIYSLGCTMYTLLTQKPAFSGETLVKKMLARIEKPLPKITDIRSDLPAAIDELLHKMIDKDRDHRFQNMTELIAAMESFRASGFAGAVIHPTAEHVLSDEPRTTGSSLAQFLDDTEVSARSRLGRGDSVVQSAAAEAEPSYSSRRRQAAGKGGASKTKAAQTRGTGNSIPTKYLIGGGGVATVLMILVAVMMFSGGGKPERDDVATGPAVAQAASEPAEEPTKPKEDFSFDLPTPDASNGGETPAPSNPAAPSPAIATIAQPGPPLTGAVDLLTSVDPLRDRLVGDWKLEGGALIAPTTSFARLQFPLVPPSEYVWEAVVERPSGNDSLAFGLVVGGRQVRLIFDANRATITGLDAINGRRFEQNVTTLLGAAFRDNLPHTIKIVVRPGSILSTFDNQTFIDWQGDERQFSLSMGTNDLPLPDRLFLTTHNTPFVFRKLTVRPLEAADQIPASPRPAMLGPYDLLSFIRVPRDSVSGAWVLNGRRLTCDPPTDTSSARLHIPLTPPAEYKLTVTAEKVWGKESFGVVLPVGNRRVAVSLDNGGGKWGGLELIDGQRANNNETALQRAIFTDNRPRTFVYRVGKGNIQVTCDGEKIIDWTGDFQRLSLIGHYSTPRPDAFVLGSWGSSFAFTRVDLEPYDVAPSSPASPGTPTTSPPEVTPTAPTVVAARIDLLKDIDPLRDTWGGLWTLTAQGLLGGPTGQGGPHPTIQLNYRPPKEYRWDVTATRTTGNDPLVLGLVGNGRQFVVVLDQRNESRLSRIDNAPDDSNNPTKTPGNLFTNGKPSQISCIVRTEGMEVLVNGRQVLKWSEYERLTNATRKIKDPLALFVGVVSSPFLLTKLEVTPLVPEGVAANGSALPPDEAIQTAALTLQEQFRDQYKLCRTSPSERANLTAALRAEAARPRVDAAHRYAALREVFQLGVDYADLPLALQSAAELASTFGMDRQPLEQQAIEARAAAAKTPADRKTLITETFVMVEDAIAKEQFLLAMRLHEMAQAEVLKIRDPALLKEARAREPILKEWEKLREQADSARKTLAATADDAAAHTALGLYQCLVLGDWQSGLPHLAKGSEEPFRKLAQQDLSKPTTTEDRAALGEGWWLAGDKANATTKINLYARSEFWYRQAVLNLTGAPRAKAQQRLQKIDEARKSAPALLTERHPIDAIPFNGHWYKLYSDRRGWREAKVACEQLGGYLVCLETPEEQKFAAQLARQLPGDPDKTCVWIGMTDEAQEGKFQWVNGAPVSYVTWNVSEPSNAGGNEHYVELMKLGPSNVAGLWNDVVGTKQSPYLCEWGR